MGFLKSLKDFSPLFTIGIFFVGFFALLWGMIHYMNSPLKEGIRELKENQVRMERRIEKRIDDLDRKLDQILSKTNKQALR